MSLSSVLHAGRLLRPADTFQIPAAFPAELVFSLVDCLNSRPRGQFYSIDLLLQTVLPKNAQLRLTSAER